MHAVVLIMSCWLAAGEPATKERVTVTLVGGAKISATLLRENKEGVVLDLGYDVVSIPAGRVLDVSRDDEEVAPTRRIQDRGIFRTGRLEAADVPELVRRFGDAVVMVKSVVGSGSGFIISPQGHLVTNYHVVEEETRLQVTLFIKSEDGFARHELKKVKILALHPLRDLALLQLDLDEVPGKKLPTPVVINDSDELDVGDLVFAIGHPLGLERSVTQGIVSSTTRKMGHLRLIQTDAAINPGNSGGPLFNARGEVVGVVCAGAVFFDGLAFGIPASDLVSFLVHRDTYVYDASQPQNGVTYLPPPFGGTQSAAREPSRTDETPPTRTASQEGAVKP